MALKRWNGTGYEDVSLARYRAAEGGPDVEPQHAYVWDGSQYVVVWANYAPISVSQPIPEQTTSTEASYVLTSFTVPGPAGETRDCRVRATVNWANRATGESYRLAFFIDGAQQHSWESAPAGTGAYSQVVEMGYETHPYPSAIPVACGSTFEVRTWVSASSAANRLVHPSSITLEEV